MKKNRRSLLLMTGALILCHGITHAEPAQEPEHDQNIAIQVKKSGNLVIVDVNLIVSATQPEVWAVLTDYDEMVKFLPNLQFSKITGKTADNKLYVSQKGKVSYGPLAFSFNAVREITLKPYNEINSHIISGSVEKADGLTQLTSEGNGTRIVYHNESLPNVWFPPVIGPSFVEKETREQFEAMKKELRRRKAAEQK